MKTGLKKGLVFIKSYASLKMVDIFSIFEKMLMSAKLWESVK